jgi:hypothetical protein
MLVLVPLYVELLAGSNHSEDDTPDWHKYFDQVQFLGGSLFVELKLEPFSYTFTPIVNTVPEKELKSANLRTSEMTKTSTAIECHNKMGFNLAGSLLRTRLLQQLLCYCFCPLLSLKLYCMQSL